MAAMTAPLPRLDLHLLLRAVEPSSVFDSKPFAPHLDGHGVSRRNVDRERRRTEVLAVLKDVRVERVAGEKHVLHVGERR